MAFEQSSSPQTPGLRVEHETRSVVVKRHDAVIASSDRALIVHGIIEAPVYYVPQDDVYMEHLTPSEAGSNTSEGSSARDGRTFLSVVASGGGVSNAAWTHERPDGDRQSLAGHVGFDPAIFNVTAG